MIFGEWERIEKEFITGKEEEKTRIKSRFQEANDLSNDKQFITQMKSSFQEVNECLINGFRRERLCVEQCAVKIENHGLDVRVCGSSSDAG